MQGMLNTCAYAILCQLMSYTFLLLLFYCCGYWGTEFKHLIDSVTSWAMKKTGQPKWKSLIISPRFKSIGFIYCFVFAKDSSSKHPEGFQDTLLLPCGLLTPPVKMMFVNPKGANFTKKHWVHKVWGKNLCFPK